MSAKEATTGFSEAEKAAMRERAAEVRAQKGGKKKAEMEKAALDAIAAMPDADRVIAERIHALVQEKALNLLAKTCYGMPAYATDDNKVVLSSRLRPSSNPATPLWGSTTRKVWTTGRCGR